jgi:predicted transposase YbfD/YdcC
LRKNERKDFENLRRIIKVERKGSRGDKTYEETAYYISSLTASAEVFAQIIRGHWKIDSSVTLGTRCNFSGREKSDQ